MRRRDGRRGAVLAGALALACVLAGTLPLAAPALPAVLAAAPAAWADTPTNEDVPTDDTGVVNPSAKDDGTGDGGTGDGDAPSGALPPAPRPNAGDAAGEGGLPTGDAPLTGTDDEPEEPAEPQPPYERPRPLVPDPVFGEGVREDNLINPQQKPDSSFIYDTSIAALQEADSYMNDQTVQVTGEVVGDRIRAEFDEGFCWIVLQSSDKLSPEIPVFMAMEYTDLIDTWGAYGRKGTTLQVRGIFHLTCPDHQGLTDLHADAVSLVEKGSVTEQVFDLGAFLPGGVLVFAGLVMLLVFRHMREGQR